MKVYELKHLFFQHMGELVYSPKSLGLFYTYNDATQAVKHYITQPGFRENRDAFSIEPKRVNGSIVDNSVFEVIIYLHSEDYTTEAEIELGLYCNEIIAQNELERYCKNNFTLLSIQKLTVEKIINKCVIGRKDWAEGFIVSNQGVDFTAPESKDDSN